MKKSRTLYLILLISLLFSCNRTAETVGDVSFSETLLFESEKDSFDENETGLIETEESNSADTKSTALREVSTKYIDPSLPVEIITSNNKEILPQSKYVELPERVFYFDEIQNAEAEVLLESFGENISVYYKDFASGYSYTWNEKQKYDVASIIKAPYCMYVYSLAERNECSLNELYTYTESNYADGTGLLKDLGYGSKISLDKLLEYSIRYSDNVAMRMIISAFPVRGFTNYAQDMGITNIDDIGYALNAKISVIDAGIYIDAIDRFIRTSEYGGMLQLDLFNTRNRMIVSQYPIARKYGWRNSSFHDMAIVYAPYPYALVILSEKTDLTVSKKYLMFKTISEFFEQFSQEDYNK